jgi:hypothetical protein
VGCAVFVLRSLRSCWSCSVAGIFRLAGCDAGSVVSSPRGWFCMGKLPVDICVVSVFGSIVIASVESMWKMSVYSRVRPVAAAEGEPSSEVWFPLFPNISDWDGVCERCVAWREYIAGLVP